MADSEHKHSKLTNKTICKFEVYCINEMRIECVTESLYNSPLCTIFASTTCCTMKSIILIHLSMSNNIN